MQTKGSSYEDICWAWIWSYVSWWIWNKSEFSWRYSLSLSLKLSKFTSFKQNPILMKKFVESQFEVIKLYYLERKADSYEDISWGSVWSHVSLWVSKKSEVSSRHLFSFSLVFCKFMSSRQNPSLTKTNFTSQFEVT